jgi:hypothetical protein
MNNDMTSDALSAIAEQPVKSCYYRSVEGEFMQSLGIEDQVDLRVQLAR